MGGGKLLSSRDPIILAAACWPPLFLFWISFSHQASIDFWQIYYLTLPHRWLTLVVVFSDADRRNPLGWWLLAALLVPAVVVGATLAASGGLICLALLDYLWNTWHFGSQHGGISRMYGMRGGEQPSFTDKWGLRILVVYALTRPVEWAFGWLPRGGALDSLAMLADGGFIALAIWIIVNSLFLRMPRNIPKSVYVVSMCLLYGGLVLSCRMAMPKATAGLLVASAMVHAWEYIAFVSRYSQSRGLTEGLIGILARGWVAFLVAYLVLLGTIGVVAESDPRFAQAWAALNIWAAFAHYWLDGMIWKLRDPKLARGLTGAT
jgi:hypothetical protein